MPTESHSSGSLTGLGLIFGFVGLVVLIVGGVLGLVSLDYVSSTTAATGTVVANTAEESCSRSQDRGTTCSTLFHPVVEFTAPSGETIRFTSSVGTDPARHSTGETVPIRFRPNDPHDATIDGFVELWMAPTIAGGIGLIFLASGIGIPVSQFRRPRKRVTDEVSNVPTWGLKP